MKNLVYCFILAMGTMVLFSCGDEELVTTDKENGTVPALDLQQNLNYFSGAEISVLKAWLGSQGDLEAEAMDMSDFPKIDFAVELSNTEEDLIKFYRNGIFYKIDDLLNDKGGDFNEIIKMIQEDERVDQNGETYLLSMIQLAVEVFVTEEVTNFFYAQSAGTAQARGCNCQNTFNLYSIQQFYCNVYGNVWGHCNQAANTLAAYNSCLAGITCPSGFTYDGSNCYAGVSFNASQWNWFVSGNLFHLVDDCSITTSNNCCPANWGFDGANCTYWGLYVPSDYEVFVYNNNFYVHPHCN